MLQTSLGSWASYASERGESGEDEKEDGGGEAARHCLDGQVLPRGVGLDNRVTAFLERLP